MPSNMMKISTANSRQIVRPTAKARISTTLKYTPEPKQILSKQTVKQKANNSTSLNHSITDTLIIKLAKLLNNDEK